MNKIKFSSLADVSMDESGVIAIRFLYAGAYGEIKHCKIGISPDNAGYADFLTFCQEKQKHLDKMVDIDLPNFNDGGDW